jgi:hypothetical protein
MRLRLPSSRGSFRVRLSLFDSVWALLSPLIALYFRDAQILSYDGLLPTILYCSVSLVFSLIAFSAFRIHDGMTRYFSVHDAIDVTKAVVVAASLTYVAVFALTRLEGVPRSTPIIHALVLIGGLIGVRIFARLFEAKRTALVPRTDVAAEHILMIGSNRLSLLYIKFIRAYSPGLHRIMAVLDDDPEMFGRAIDGVRVIGPTDQLEPVVNEFSEHGVRISHVIVGGDPDMIAEGTLPEIERICDEHEIKLDFVPQLIGLQALQPAVQLQSAAEPNEFPAEPKEPAKLDAELPPYFAFKRYLDLLATVTILILLSPVWLLVGAVALWDVGSPIFFWQQRLGHALRLARPQGRGRRTVVRHRAPRAQVSFRRIPAAAQRARRRHILDRTPSAAATGSTVRSRHAIVGTPRNYRLGSSERRQFPLRRGERCTRRVVQSAMSRCGWICVSFS